MKKILITMVAIHFMWVGWALADSGIAETHRDAIQTAMKNHIEDVSEKNGNGMFPVFAMTLVFDNCNAGTVSFNIPTAGESGTFNIERAVESNKALCEALDQQTNNPPTR